MRPRLTLLRRRLLGISPQEATFARRGFRRGETGAQAHLERAGTVFLTGYHLALEHDEPATLAARLGAVEPEWQGFAFEGAAMGLALLDQLLPKHRLQAFLEGPGAAHAYMVHVGVGWALARLHRRVERPLARLDPLLRWLAVDGYGFHEGYFRWPRYLHARARPRKLSGYALHAFDQGLGRSLWFVEGADVEQIAQTIGTFFRARQADLWSGVGLACAYAGGAEHEAIKGLWERVGPFRPQLAQGAAFAAQARHRAGNPTEHTMMACEILCGTSAEEAAAFTERALQGLPRDRAVPAYEVWRQRIQAHFADQKTSILASEG